MAAFAAKGSRMVKRLEDLKGDTSSKGLAKVFPPAGARMGKINETLLTMQRWMDEERAITTASDIIQDRLIFGASNLTPLLSLQGRFIFELSSTQTLVTQWQREFDKEAQAAAVEKAEKERRAAKAAKTSKGQSPGAPVEERCRATKDWAGQNQVDDAISLESDEIVYRLEDMGGGWAKVRRESDGKVGRVPAKRLCAAPVPEMEEEASEPEGDDASPPKPPPPVLSDDDDEEDSTLDNLQAPEPPSDSEPPSDDEEDAIDAAMRESLTGGK